MNKLKLLLEIIKHSTKAKIIACSAGAGVIAIGGGIAYGIATNNNATVADNKNGSEIVTTYNETEKEEVKDKDKDKDKDKEVVKEETKDESKPVVNEEVKKDDTSTSTSTTTSSSSSNEKPSTTTSDTKPNSGTTTEPQVETPPTEPQVETPPSYKAAGIDWELTAQANQLRVSIYNDYKGTRGEEIKEITKNVCLYNSEIPQWLIDGINDPVRGEVKYKETRIGKYTITDANQLRNGVVQSYSQTMDANLEHACMYMKVENDGQGNIIVTCANVVMGSRK